MTTGANILIVDDSLVGQETLDALLASEGYRLAFASSGPEALEYVSGSPPDLILLDVMMPDMDGYEVCRRLRADPKVADIPVIMITALDDRESRLAGIAAGADDFIAKPYDRMELRARIRTITQLNRYRRMVAEHTRFEWVVENATDGWVLVNEADEVLYLNPTARLYLNLMDSPAVPSGIRFLEVASQNYRPEPPEAWAAWPELPAATRDAHFLVRPETPTAKSFWLKATIQDRSAGSDSARLICLRDITQQIDTQREIRTFHNMLMHKLNSPLWLMQSSMELLAETHLSQVETQDLAQIALQGIERLRGEIENVWEYLQLPVFARAGAGVAARRFAEIVAQLATEFKLADLELTTAQALRQRRLVLSEQAAEWMMLELLSNAQKFHPNRDPRLEVTATLGDEMTAVVRVTDDGLVLSPEQLILAWIPYYQGEKYLTGNVPGMGLGLSAVASMIWSVGGSCRMYNRANGPGIVVELTIPLEPPA